MLAAAFVKSVMDLGDPEQSYSGVDWFGFGPPLVITAAFAVLGVMLLIAQWRYRPEFFHRHPEAAEPPASEAKRPTLRAAGQHR
jgi:hypothetical protein